MSTVKSLYDLDTASNSLLNISVAPAKSVAPKRKKELDDIRQRYRDEYLKYQEEKETRMAERLMRLDYVISNAQGWNTML